MRRFSMIGAVVASIAIAAYCYYALYRPAWVFWQYHNRGTVIGIDGPVDRNVYRGSITEFAAFAGRANEGITR